MKLRNELEQQIWTTAYAAAYVRLDISQKSDREQRDQGTKWCRIVADRSVDDFRRVLYTTNKRPLEVWGDED